MVIGSSWARRGGRVAAQATAGLVLLAGATSVSSSGAHAETPPPHLAYRVVELGKPATGWSFVGGINEHGQVSGTDVSITYSPEHDHSSITPVAWMWDPTTGAKADLSDWSQAGGINEHGDLAVMLPESAGRWDAATSQLVPLPGLYVGSRTAVDIDDDGVVVGSGAVDAEHRHAVRWVADEADDLGALAGGNAASNAINGTGQVVGTSEGHAFRWDPGTGTMADLGLFGGTEAGATDIDDAGRVLGSAKLADGTRRSFVTAPDGTDPTFLGTLGGASTWAYALNDRGLVVGSSQTATGASQAFVRYPDGAMVALPGGGTTSVAVAVNDRGWIAGSIGEQAVVWVPAGFRDVPAGAAFHDEIGWALEQGIVAGFGDGTFRPALAVSRQAAAAMLYRLAGSPSGAHPTCSTAPFTDVPVDHPFCGEIAWLAQAGLSTGYGGRFLPDAALSRQALAAFLYRLAGHPDGEVPPCPPPAPFPDVPLALGSCGMIRWLAATGIASGYADGGFHPTAPVTRQALAAFLHRFAHR